MSYRKRSSLPLAVEAIRQALLGTHQVGQTKKSYKYRGPDLSSPIILKGYQTIRKALSPEGQCIEAAEGLCLFDSLLMGLYLLGKQDGYRQCDEDLSHLRKIYRDIQQSQHINEYQY